MKDSANCGCFTAYKKEIPSVVLTIFDEATNKLTGVAYEPLNYASQVVNGTNYSFFCNASPLYPESFEYAVLIEIYKPLEADPYITKIQKVH
ncbi:hypothetical protein K5X82_05940 [Halosquirtibacter xylanolyticus]|uniref:hypothetical protein n=1 Tax=Halosquirtibacter xylanolyticus TaxID=3374599 RepID=UPI003749B361|nr:hypothetical protein K5X82_05940 [Prolixibacteraceae bacterium]